MSFKVDISVGTNTFEIEKELLGFVVDGQGIALLAPSGVGKTTHMIC